MMTRSRAAFAGTAFGALGLAAASTGALAQASGCGDLQSHLIQRKSIAESLTPKGKQQMDAKVACQGFNQLVANGDKLLKWAAANKEWCQIPDGFIDSIKTDHGKAQQIRGRACGMAAKQNQMEQQAKNGGGGGGGLLGGGGLTGSTSLPQGAL